MGTTENITLTREIFGAIERRDETRLRDLFHPEIEFHWPPSLPYGGSGRGRDWQGPTWSETWDPLQPTEVERRMDARVVAACDDEVVALWRQRGRSPDGERFDSPVLGLYRIRDGKLARAQMFYFDPVAVADFLAKATDGRTVPE